MFLSTTCPEMYMMETLLCQTGKLISATAKLLSPTGNLPCTTAIFLCKHINFSICDRNFSVIHIKLSTCNRKFEPGNGKLPYFYIKNDVSLAIFSFFLPNHPFTPGASLLVEEKFNSLVMLMLLQIL